MILTWSKIGKNEDQIYRRKSKRIASSKLDEVHKGAAYKYLNKGNNDNLSIIEEGKYNYFLLSLITYLNKKFLTSFFFYSKDENKDNSQSYNNESSSWFSPNKIEKEERYKYIFITIVFYHAFFDRIIYQHKESILKAKRYHLTCFICLKVAYF